MNEGGVFFPGVYRVGRGEKGGFDRCMYSQHKRPRTTHIMLLISRRPKRLPPEGQLRHFFEFLVQVGRRCHDEYLAGKMLVPMISKACTQPARENSFTFLLTNYSRCKTTITPIIPNKTFFSHGCSDSTIVT